MMIMMVDERTSLLESTHRQESQRISARRCQTRRLWLFLVFIILTPIISILILRWRRTAIPKFVDHEYGVGFHLSYPYGTISISYPNGTIVNIAKIEGQPAYKEVMSRLSLESSEHLHPPYRTLEEAFLDYPRQEKRRLRKEAGLPASSDVGILAAFIQTLRSHVEAHLDGRPISGVAVSVPHFWALYAEDLEDAFEYAGLIYLQHYPFWSGGIFYEAGAAYASNGFGLCSNYTDVETCEEERKHPPHQRQRENVLTVGYTRGMLTSTWSSQGMWFALPQSENILYTVADFNLGYDNKPSNGGSREDDYWALVRDGFLTPLLEANKYMRVDTHKVVLHGECADDEQFQTVVEEALAAAARNLNASNVFAKDSVYAPARGAAEMAKRVWWTYNHTGHSSQ